MYTRCGVVAAYHVVCIGLCLWSVRVCVFLPVLWTTGVGVNKLSDLTTCTVQIKSWVRVLLWTSAAPPTLNYWLLFQISKIKSVFFNVITFIASFLRGATQGNMASQRERTVPEMTHSQPWLPSPTADPHSHDCYMNTSYSMHNTQSRLPVNDNDVITSIRYFNRYG